MWERTLQDLIRGLRANKKDEAKFIAQAVNEIRQEIKGEDMELKAGAVLKLTYLDMIGYDMSWAAFHIVEVMSSPKTHLKSVGYLAAAQSFDEDTDVLMLTTNLLKKDLTAPPADVAVTVSGVSHFMTFDLARDLAPELVGMLNHSRPPIRKKAIAALYKALDKHPDSIYAARPRLIEKLDDPDTGVVVATVNVLCELGRRNPKDYLSLAPQLFHLLTTSSNNWMIIKLVKLFGFLAPHEPRLVKKLQPPITELISTTPAISLLYECVHTCIIGGMLQGPSGDSLAKTCVSKLAAFLQDEDQNLKYIALLAMTKIVPSHPHLMAEYQDMILASVNDQDISIRIRALELVSAMVDRDSLQSIVQRLLSHLVPDSSSASHTSAAQSLVHNTMPNGPPPAISPNQSPAYRLVLAQRILTMCSQSTYENVNNFEWYLSVLVDLAHIANVDVGAKICDQLVDVLARVRAARPYGVKLMYNLLCDDTLLRNVNEEGSCSEVLWAAAWICGEYCRELDEPEELLPNLLQHGIIVLAPETISMYILAATKIFGYVAAELADKWDDDDLAALKTIVDLVVNRVGELASSSHIEVQERAANTLQLFKFIQADINSFTPKPSPAGPSSSFDPIPISEPHHPKSLFLIQPLFSAYDLNPVAVNAQESVPIPEGLDLDTWIVQPPKEPEPVSAIAEGKPKKSKKGKEKAKGKERAVNGLGKGKKKRRTEGDDDQPAVEGPHIVLVPAEEETLEDIAERERRKAERLAQQREDPYYIVDDRQPLPSSEDIDAIPVVKIEGMPPLLQKSHDNRLSSLKPIEPSISKVFVIDKEGEMPEGAISPRPAASPAPTQIASPAPESLKPFPFHEVPSDPQTITPEPIKVTRPKKKGTGKKKKIATDT